MKPAFSAVLALTLLAWTVGPSTVARAGDAEVVAVEAVSEGSGSWRFHVTVAHGDTGWQHYADK